MYASYVTQSNNTARIVLYVCTSLSRLFMSALATHLSSSDRALSSMQLVIQIHSILQGIKFIKIEYKIKIRFTDLRTYGRDHKTHFHFLSA